MLRRPKFHSVMRERSQERRDPEVDIVPSRPLRTASPVYERDLTKNWNTTAIKPKRDPLLSLLRDRRFHSIEELERVLPRGEWANFMRAALAQGYAFVRASEHFRLRLREVNEVPQSLFDLLDGIDLNKFKKVAVEEESVESESLENEQAEDFDPTSDPASVTDVSEDLQNGLVLSDPAFALTLSAANTAVMTAAILAKKSSGKTYLAMVLAEEFMSSIVTTPLVVIDPMGVWYGLRATVEGLPSRFKLLTLGGSHGDLPITAKSGRKAAEIVNAVRPVPVIFDLSDLSPFEQHEFVADFGDHFMATAEKSPLHIIVDEADEFAPQRLNKGSEHHKRCLDAMDRLVRRGRNKGIGMTMITQRTAVISKNLLSQTDALWLLNMLAPNDLQAVDDWLANRVTDEQRSECLGQISRLPLGVVFFTQSGVYPKFRRFKVRCKTTFDSSKTPGCASRVVPALAQAPGSALEIARSILMINENTVEEDE